LKNNVYSIEFIDKAQIEYNNLDGSQKVFVDKGLERIKILGTSAGQSLSGELNKCRKLKNKPLGLRIIFTQTNQKIRIIKIIAIGQREDKKVYK